MATRAVAELLTGIAMVLTACADVGEQDALRYDYGLIAARFPECQESGHKLARYLDTGRPTALDPDFGEWRQHVLSLSGEARALAIRQHAAELIDACDDEVADERRFERGLAADARAARVEEARNREALRRYRDGCAKLGGQVIEPDDTFLFHGPNHESCVIDYPQMSGFTGTFHIPLDEHGNLHEDTYRRGLCAHWKAEGRGDWWHEDTHVCALDEHQQHVIGDD